MKKTIELRGQALRQRNSAEGPLRSIRDDYLPMDEARIAAAAD